MNPKDLSVTPLTCGYTGTLGESKMYAYRDENSSMAHYKAAGGFTCVMSSQIKYQFSFLAMDLFSQ